MTTLRTAPLTASLASLLVVVACGQPPPADGGLRPDVVLITIDALRADALSCAGNPLIRTPNLDHLATDGVMFSQAISSFVGTTAAMPSLMTGRYPSFEGVAEWNPATHCGFSHLNDPDETASLTRNVDTLAEILAARGYLCAGFNTNPNLGPGSGFAQGFAHFESFAGYLDQRARTRGHPLEGHYPPADVVVDGVLEWLVDTPDRPLFLWLHLMDPHSPYLPPAPFARLPHRTYTAATDLQINEALYRIVIGQWGSPPPRHYTAVEDLPGSAEDSLEHLKALYEGEIRFADRELGRLFAGLATLGRWDRSLVIVTADHGEEFFEHGHVIHHLLEPALEELIRIPLILRLPASAAHGRRVDALVRMVDIAPTILDLAAGSPPLPDMDGRSLRPLIEGHQMPELTAFINAIDFGVARGSRWKFRRILRPLGSHPPGDSLYDIVADPGETRDLSARQPEVLSEMRGRYQDFVTRLRLRGAPPPGLGSRTPEIDPEVQERLKALGYAGR